MIDSEGTNPRMSGSVSVSTYVHSLPNVARYRTSSPSLSRAISPFVFSGSSVRPHAFETLARCVSETDLGRGAYQTVIYPETVHFKDAEGQWKEIDNRLEEARNEQGEAILRNQSNVCLLYTSRCV